MMFPFFVFFTTTLDFLILLVSCEGKEEGFRGEGDFLFQFDNFTH